jgi:hypothetical protein
MDKDLWPTRALLLFLSYARKNAIYPIGIKTKQW